MSKAWTSSAKSRAKFKLVRTEEFSARAIKERELEASIQEARRIAESERGSTKHKRRIDKNLNSWRFRELLVKPPSWLIRTSNASKKYREVE